MEEGIPCIPYVISRKFHDSRKNIYDYTLETFGLYYSHYLLDCFVYFDFAQ